MELKRNTGTEHFASISAAERQNLQAQDTFSKWRVYLCCEDTDSVPAQGWVRSTVLENHPGTSKCHPRPCGGSATAGHGQGRSSRQGKGCSMELCSLSGPRCGASISSLRL